MEMLTIFIIGLLLMLLINFGGRRFIPGVRQSSKQLILISIVQAIMIVLLVFYIF